MTKKVTIGLGLICLLILLSFGAFYLFGKNLSGGGGVDQIVPVNQSEIKNTGVCDVRKVDFANYKVDTTQFGKLNFQNSIYVQNDDVGNPDWEFTIAKNTTIYTFGSDVVRVVDITNDHVSGSGAWDIVVGYICSNSQVIKVLEQASISKVIITEKGNDQLELQWGEGYNGASPPEKESTKVIQWNQQLGKFVIVSQSQ